MSYPPHKRDPQPVQTNQPSDPWGTNTFEPFALLAASSAPFVALERSGAVLYYNPAAARLVSADHQRNRNSPEIAQRLEDAFAGAIPAWLAALAGDKRDLVSNLGFPSQFGEPRLVRWSIAPLPDEDGDLAGLVLVGLPSQQPQAGDGEASPDKFHMLAELVSDALFLIDNQDGQILEVNPAAEALYGYSRRELLSMKNTDLSAEPERTRQAMSEQARRVPVRFHRNKRGQVFPVEITGQHFNWQGRSVHIAAIRDITERQQIEDRLRYLSTHDALTGVYNRFFLEEEMARLKSSRLYPISLVVVDVDGMKLVNDQLGHAAGDDLLRRASQVLQTAFRAEDIVARIGGDEFVVLLPQTGVLAAERSLERVRELVHTHNQAHPGLPLHLSLGSATASPGGDLQATFEAADRHMYADKQAKTIDEQYQLRLPGVGDWK